MSAIPVIKPMKAAPATVEGLPLPCLIDTKYDGIRAIVLGGVVYSLSLKPIRNKDVQAAFGKQCYNGLDMELVVGDIYAPDCFQKTTSIVMALDKPIGDLKAYVFDEVLHPQLEYPKRFSIVQGKLAANPHPKLIASEATLCSTREEIQARLDVEAKRGGEGLIGRVVASLYKYGRSTLKQGWLMKVKFYAQSEFKVVGFTEQMHNANEAQVNELGRTARSSSKEGLVPKNTLGALVVEMPDGKQFNCGTGFSDELRKEVWDNQEKYLGSWASVKYMATGIKELPRHPVFVGFRHEDDMSYD